MYQILSTLYRLERNVEKVLNHLEIQTHIESSTVLFVSGNFYNMINETNREIGSEEKGLFLQIPNEDVMETSYLYTAEEFLRLLLIADAAYLEQAKKSDKCIGGNAKFPSYLFEHYACIRLLLEAVKYHNFVYIANMSWADYFPTGSEAQLYNKHIMNTYMKCFDTTFDKLDKDTVPSCLIDAGSSKTKFVSNKLSLTDKTSFNEFKAQDKISFPSLQDLTDEEIDRLKETKKALVGEEVIPLIATAGIRAFLNDTEVPLEKKERLTTVVIKLNSAGIVCVVASGALESALEQNAAKNIFEDDKNSTSELKALIDTKKYNVCCLSMGGQSTQYSNGENHYSYDNMGAIAIKKMCCKCEATCMHKKKVCKKLQHHIARTMKLFSS